MQRGARPFSLSHTGKHAPSFALCSPPAASNTRVKHRLERAESTAPCESRLMAAGTAYMPSPAITATSSFDHFYTHHHGGLRIIDKRCYHTHPIALLRHGKLPRRLHRETRYRSQEGLVPTTRYAISVPLLISPDLSSCRDKGTCWDEDDVILRCRNCQAEFSLILRKHHCRSCGGIYCDACNPAGAAQIAASPSSPMSEGVDEEGYYMGKYVGRKNPRRRSDVSEASANSTTSSPAAPAAGASVAPAVPVAKEEGFWLGKFLGRPNPKGGPPSAQPPKKGPDDGARYCLGCRMAETPCERVKTILKDKYVSVMATRSEPRPPSRQLTLSRGSLYGETSKVMQRTDGREAHKSGYIEILNKGDFVFCVKMFTGQSDIFRESSRPSYIAGKIYMVCAYECQGLVLTEYFSQCILMRSSTWRLSPRWERWMWLYCTGTGTDRRGSLLSGECGSTSRSTPTSSPTAPLSLNAHWLRTLHN